MWGPPRGPTHHSQDGRWWWDDSQGRWLATTDQEDVLEIEAEDLGGTSLAASLLTTLSSQYGNAYFQFVARARSNDPAGGPTPWPGDLPSHPTPERHGRPRAWLKTQREPCEEPHQQLLQEGWRGRPWPLLVSATYRRPDLDWDTQHTPTTPDLDTQARAPGEELGRAWTARRGDRGVRCWPGRRDSKPSVVLSRR